jgi:hypothetical protein
MAAATSEVAIGRRMKGVEMLMSESGVLDRCARKTESGASFSKKKLVVLWQRKEQKL